MHMLRHFIPRHIIACPVRTEYGTCRIFHITLRIIANCLYNFFCIVTRMVSGKYTGKPSFSMRISCNFSLIIAHGCHRCQPFDPCPIAFLLRRLCLCCQPLHIIQRSSCYWSRNLKFKCIIRFQQHTVRLHQSLPDRAISRLTEVTAFRML